MLSIYDLCREGTNVLGPGKRYVIWTQGCPFHCDGCVTPQSRPVTHDNMLSIVSLAEDIVSRDNINGITISGGEPFLQAGKLAELLELTLSQRPELTVMSYTGYQIEDLRWQEAQRLLTHLDLLIDGPYMSELNDGQGVRGSSNQRFHYLSSRLLPWKEEMEHGKRKLEAHLKGSHAYVYGIPSLHFSIKKLLTK